MSTIQINYKSGQSVTLNDASKFNVTYTEDGLTKVEWVTGGRMRPLWLNMNEIESVWEVFE